LKIDFNEIIIVIFLIPILSFVFAIAEDMIKEYHFKKKYFKNMAKHESKRKLGISPGDTSEKETKSDKNVKSAEVRKEGWPDDRSKLN
jgi:hypothetical protein